MQLGVVLWSGLLGSAISAAFALVGVFVGGAFSRRGVQAQIESENRRRRLDKRLDVYVDVANVMRPTTFSMMRLGLAVDQREATSEQVPELGKASEQLEELWRQLTVLSIVGPPEIAGRAARYLTAATKYQSACLKSDAKTASSDPATLEREEQWATMRASEVEFLKLASDHVWDDVRPSVVDT